MLLRTVQVMRGAHHRVHGKFVFSEKVLAMHRFILSVSAAKAMHEGTTVIMRTCTVGTRSLYYSVMDITRSLSLPLFFFLFLSCGLFSLFHVGIN